MTKEEAIKWLIYPTITTTGETKGIQKKQLDAYHMAIEALLTNQYAKNERSDLINRADAIKTVISWLPKEHHLMLKGTLALEDIVNALDSVSSVSVESKRGEWIRQTNGDGWNEWYVNTCDQCGFQVGNKHDDRAYRYCPNCGARMASK